VEIGRLADDDADLMARREDGLAQAGSSTVAGIRSDLLALDAAVSVQVFENYTDETNLVTRLPPKSFEVVVYAPDATDDAVAQAVWNSKPGGIEPVGTSSGTAIDGEGNPQVMRFSRVAQVEVWVSYRFAKLAGYPGDAVFKETVATRLDAAFRSGQSVGFYDVAMAVHGLGADLDAVAIGLAPAPTSDAEIAIGSRQIARFDAARITVLA
jgi:hypothetical protein